MGAKEELEKIKKSWEHQKQNELSEARICDAYIKATNAAIQLIEQDEAKASKKTKDSS